MCNVNKIEKYYPSSVLRERKFQMGINYPEPYKPNIHIIVINIKKYNGKKIVGWCIKRLCA